jgi:hypothetical protein
MVVTVLLQLGDSLPGRVDPLKRLVRFVEQSARPLHGAVDLIDGPASRVCPDVLGSSFHELPFVLTVTELQCALPSDGRLRFCGNVLE